jgi:DNA mismatch endonuclease (patch repair protein)
MDIWSKKKRSQVMSKIRSKNTRPEKTMRSALFSLGYRYRIHVKQLPGKPDMVLAKYRTVIFVQGCFWHQHTGCREGRIPSTNSDFWKDKLNRNTERDAANIRQLKKLKWQVLVVWECEIEKQFGETVKKVISHLKRNI